VSDVVGEQALQWSAEAAMISHATPHSGGRCIVMRK
jgi:hypothetical protein